MSNPTAGAISDAHGRRRLLIGSLLAQAVAVASVGIFPSRGVLVLGGVLRGVTSVSLTMGNSMLIDLSRLSAAEEPTATPSAAPVPRRTDATTNLGYALAAVALGLLAGPVAGGIIGLVSQRLVFVLAGLVEVCNCIFAWRLVPETLTTVKPFAWRNVNPFRLVKVMFSTPALRHLTGILLVANIGLAAYSQAALYTQHRFHWESLQLGAFLTFAGLVVAIGTIVMSLLLPRYGERRVLVAALAIGVLHFVAIGVAWEGWMWYIIFALTCAMWAAPIALRGLITKQATRAVQGYLQGWWLGGGRGFAVH